MSVKLDGVSQIEQTFVTRAMPKKKKILPVF